MTTACLVAALLPAGTLAAAAPTGTDAGTAGGPVAVSSTAPTPNTRDYLLEAAGGNWVVFTVDSTTYAEPAGGGHLVTLPDAVRGGLVQISGDLVVYQSKKHKEPDYYDLATGTSGVGDKRWGAASPSGGVYTAVDSTDGSVHAYEQNAETSASTDLGVLAGFDTKDGISELNDDHGVVFFQYYGSGKNHHNRASYIAFDHPGTVVPLRTHDQGDETCLSLSENALGCASTGHSIYRVPLDGSAPQVIPVTFPKVPAAARVFSLAFVTATRTFWGFEYAENETYDGPRPDQPLHSVPADSPNAKPVATSFTLSEIDDYTTAATSGDTAVYVTRYGSPAQAGVYRVSSDGTRRTAFHIIGSAPAVAMGVAIGSGQVVFADDSVHGYGTRLRTRLFTRSGNTVEPGRIVDLATNDVDAYSTVAASGSRVLYDDDKGIRVVPVAGSGTAHRSLQVNGYETIALSGTRAVIRRSHDQHVVLLNLVTGHTTDLSKKYGAYFDAALFGNYLAYPTRSGFIRRLDLTTKKSVTLARPSAATRHMDLYGLAAWGDYVAWDFTKDGSTYSTYFRNARTMAAKVRLPKHDAVVGASNEGVTLQPAGPAGPEGPTSVRSWTSDRTHTVHKGTSDGGDPGVFVGSSTVVYTHDAGDQAMPGAGTVYARPLADVGDRPRSLGNAFGSAHTSRGHTWHLDLPTSASLTSCHVTLRRHGHAVRTLACVRGLMRLGEVSVSWNGRTSSGHRAEKGAYRVVVSASNVDGTLLAADGSHAATTRTVTVR